MEDSSEFLPFVTGSKGTADLLDINSVVFIAPNGLTTSGTSPKVANGLVRKVSFRKYFINRLPKDVNKKCNWAEARPSHTEMFFRFEALYQGFCHLECNNRTNSKSKAATLR